MRSRSPSHHSAQEVLHISSINQTESAELVRRHERWFPLKVTDIYLQEVAASMFMTDISDESGQMILTANEQLTTILQMSAGFAASWFSEKVWYLLFRQHANGVQAIGTDGRSGNKAA